MPNNIPNLYAAYDIATQSGILGKQKAFVNTIKTFLTRQDLAQYQYAKELIENNDGSVTTSVSIPTAEYIGQITFKVNPEKQQIEAIYSNDILEQIFQPLFNPNYYIPYSDRGRLAETKQAEFRQFYTSPEALQFAAGIEQIDGLYQKIKQKSPALTALGTEKILERRFLGRTIENEKVLKGKQLTEEEKIIAEINEIAQKEFFRTLPMSSFNPNDLQNIERLKQRFTILNHLSAILSAYSQGKSPTKTTITQLRVAVKALNEADNHGESKAQRILSSIGMGIGIPAFIAAIVLLVLMVTLPISAVWVSIAIPALFFGGGLIGGWSALAVQWSFPGGVAKDLYFVADKMEAEFDKNFPNGIEENSVQRASLVAEETKGQGNFVGPITQATFRNSNSLSAGQEIEYNTDENDLHRLLESASKNLTKQQQTYLFNGLNQLLNRKSGYTLENVRDEIEAARKSPNTCFESLCSAVHVTSKIQGASGPTR